MATNKIRMDLEVKDDGTATITRFSKKAEQSFTKIERSASKLNNVIDRLSKSIFNLRNALVATAAATAATAAMTRFTQKAINYGDKIAKTADLLGITTANFQRLTLAADLAGISQQNLIIAMRRFQRQVDDARRGTGPLVDMFERYNISLVDTAGGNARSWMDIMRDLADVIADTESGQTRLNIAFKSFGMYGTQMVNLLKAGGTALKKQMQIADKYGLIIDEKILRESEKAKDQLTILWEVVKVKLTKAMLDLAPAITRVIERLLDWMEVNSEIIDSNLDEYINKLGEVLDNIGKNLDSVIKKIKALWNILEALGKLAVAVFVGKILQIFIKFGAAAAMVTAAAAMVTSSGLTMRKAWKFVGKHANGLLEQLDLIKAGFVTLLGKIKLLKKALTGIRDIGVVKISLVIGITTVIHKGIGS